MKAFRFWMLAGMGFLFSTMATAQQNRQSNVSPTQKTVFVPMRVLVAAMPAQPVFISPCQGTVDGNMLLHLPARYNLNNVANLFAGVVSINGQRPSIRGSRPDATAYYIDGVRMIDFEPISCNFVYQDQFKLNRPDYEGY